MRAGTGRLVCLAHVSSRLATIRSTNTTAEHYGHPSKFGFKDIDNLWKAEKWDPEKLIQLYKRAGAKYFVALANHHGNFDC